MTVKPGNRFGAYEIVALLGAGGMGEVYRARDTRLQRDVAIKVLPAAFVLDPDRIARFKREAQLLASLNHPNIAAIHGLEHADGTYALVLELVEGPTLAERLVSGPIPGDEALLIAQQIADALAAAHGQGIIHRDLKPANIKIRPDGTVKVLDFGLGKALQGDGGATDASHSPTLNVTATRGGIILGTAAYMAPEQAKGKAVDKRADVWAFGCVLYETLCGKAAFAADTVTETLAAVLRSEPDWTRIPPDTPAAIRRALRRCLQKDPKDRLHDINDVRLEIYDARTNPDPGAFPSAEDSRTGTAGIWIVPLEGDRKPFSFLTTDFGETGGQFSPDGRWVAYSSDESGGTEVYVRPFPGPGGYRQVSRAGGRQPRWRADGKELYYISPQVELVAVPIETRGNLVEPGAPKVLFQTEIGVEQMNNNAHQYDVAADGRFLINVTTDEPTFPPITLILNWRPPDTASN